MWHAFLTHCSRRKHVLHKHLFHDNVFCFCLLNCTGLLVLNYLPQGTHSNVFLHTQSGTIRGKCCGSPYACLLPFITPHTTLTSFLIIKLRLYKSKEKTQPLLHTFSFSIFLSFFFCPSVSFPGLFPLYPCFCYTLLPSKALHCSSQSVPPHPRLPPSSSL